MMVNVDVGVFLSNSLLSFFNFVVAAVFILWINAAFFFCSL